VRRTAVTALCLFALAMACSRQRPSHSYCYADTLPDYGITETVHYSRIDAGLNERQ
jgi:hypothetical protein